MQLITDFTDGLHFNIQLFQRNLQLLNDLISPGLDYTVLHFASLMNFRNLPVRQTEIRVSDKSPEIEKTHSFQFNGKTFVEKFTLPVIPIISRYDFFSRYLLRQILMNWKVCCFPTDKIQPSDSSQKQQKISIPAM